MRILVLGTVRPAHKRLFAMGHELILFIGKKSAKPTDINDMYHQTCVLADDAKSEVWAGLAQSIHQQYPIDAVCAFHDNCQQHAILIAKQLGLYFPVTSETVSLVADKVATRQRLEQENLNNVSFYQINNEAALNTIKPELSEYPYILKPMKGTGSLGIKKIHTAEDLEAAALAYRENTEFYPAILERFVNGEEFSVEGFSENGKFHLLSITRKFKDENTFVEIGHATPALLPDTAKSDIFTYLTQVLVALGINNGPSHSEIILADGQIHLVETHTRVGGDCIPDLVKHATGIDLYELIGRQALGEDISGQLQQSGNAHQASAIWYKAPSFQNIQTVLSVPDLSALHQDTQVADSMILKPVGETVGKLTNSFDRMMYVITTGADETQAIELAKETVANQHFETTAEAG